MTRAVEHKIVRFEMGWKGFDYAAMEAQLNELGRHGWQAVSPIQPHIGGVASAEIVVLLTRTADR